MEECAEVQQACSKALRFGIDTANDKDQINKEINDVEAIIHMLYVEQILPLPKWNESRKLRHKKEAKVLRYMKVSEELGTLDKEC